VSQINITLNFGIYNCLNDDDSNFKNIVPLITHSLSYFFQTINLYGIPSAYIIPVIKIINIVADKYNKLYTLYFTLSPKLVLKKTQIQ
jgi:hypothetical protein